VKAVDLAPDRQSHFLIETGGRTLLYFGGCIQANNRSGRLLPQ
jgi:hypothetical protein